MKPQSSSNRIDKDKRTSKRMMMMRRNGYLRKRPTSCEKRDGSRGSGGGPSAGGYGAFGGQK
jgi:hypothetical protein